MSQIPVVRRSLFPILAGLLACSGIVRAEVSFDRDGIESFLDAHCYECHDDLTTEADLDLYALSDDLSDHQAFLRWSQILTRVEKVEMPPEKKARPETDELAHFVSHLEGSLVAVEEADRDKYGRAELRRLSAVEYANSLKDLLDLPRLDFAEKLPPDGLDGHHAKSSAALDFSHVMVSKYLEVADYALRRALVPELDRQPKETVRSELKSVEGVRDTLQTLFVQLKQGIAIPLIDDQPDLTTTSTQGNFEERDPGVFTDEPPYFNGVATFMNNRFNHNITMKPFKVTQTGHYRVRVHGWALLNDHGELLPSDRTETVAFYDGTGDLLGRVDLQPNEPNTGEVTMWLEAGETVQYLAISTPHARINFRRHYGEAWKHFKSHGVALQWFEMEGPLGKYPPESHERLLGDITLKKAPPQENGLAYVAVSDNPKQDADRLIRTFANRAFRRPVTEQDLEIPLGVAHARIDQGESLIESILAGYRAVLTSPGFMLREESPGDLNAWALATRLAYFLTNSPPDEELRALAASGDLLKPAELRRQANRLIGRPKSKRFVEHFLDYWLNLRNINLTAPDENLYPEYSGLVSESMVEETRAYYHEMVRKNLGALHVIDSDFLMINQRLAKLYGIPGVRGSDIQKVSIPDDSVRGGLLTQGSLLKLTANGTTTSPVVRGTFMLEHLLGDPPPPVPAAVPAIEPDISGATTVREQLALHREDIACASCHAKIDPPGFALESFDVMGQWRENYRASVERGQRGADVIRAGAPVRYKFSAEVDSSGELSDGSEFSDVNDFRRLLHDSERQIAQSLLEHLILYSTGGPVSFSDRPEVERILNQLEEEGYGTRSMILEIVQSDLFRQK